jgi:hypothetical protein
LWSRFILELCRGTPSETNAIDAVHKLDTGQWAPDNTHNNYEVHPHRTICNLLNDCVDMLDSWLALHIFVTVLLRVDCTNRHFQVSVLKKPTSSEGCVTLNTDGESDRVSSLCHIT